MRKNVANDEKRIPEVVADYSEELERIMENPDLLMEEESFDKWVEDDLKGTYEGDNYRDHGSSHSHHNSSRSRHSSSHHRHSSSSGYSSDSHSSQYHSGGGRLASHHRSRHHHHSRNESSKQEFIAPLSSDTVTIDAGEYSYSHDFEERSEPSVKNEYADNTANTQTAKDASVNRSNIVPPRVVPAGERTKRIASKTSGSESSKRAAERAAETSKNRKRSKKSSNRRTRKKQIGFFGVITRILVFFLVIGLAAVGSLLVLRALGERAMKNADDVTIDVPENPDVDVDDDGKIITYKGEKYRYNEDVTTILFMGTDRTVAQQESSETLIGANGQADTIILGVVDNKNKKISFLSINRDTMTPVAEYTVDDEYAGNKIMQICLAYSYGADNEQSCERMATAVSEYLYGMPINAYCRLSYDGIPPLNDAVGGVTVKVPEDMTSIEPEWSKGTKVELHGKDAITYVRWRNTKTVKTNELRMARQKQYLNAYIKQTLRQVRNDLTLPINLYSLVTSYMTTDITASKITYLSSKALEYGISMNAIQTVPGESKDGEEHVEFYSDDTALFEIILSLFYNKI